MSVGKLLRRVALGHDLAVAAQASVVDPDGRSLCQPLELIKVQGQHASKVITNPLDRVHGLARWSIGARVQPDGKLNSVIGEAV